MSEPRFEITSHFEITAHDFIEAPSPLRFSLAWMMASKGQASLALDWLFEATGLAPSASFLSLLSAQRDQELWHESAPRSASSRDALLSLCEALSPSVSDWVASRDSLALRDFLFQTPLFLLREPLWRDALLGRCDSHALGSLLAQLLLLPAELSERFSLAEAALSAPEPFSRELLASSFLSDPSDDSLLNHQQAALAISARLASPHFATLLSSLGEERAQRFIQSRSEPALSLSFSPLTIALLHGNRAAAESLSDHLGLAESTSEAQRVIQTLQRGEAAETSLLQLNRLSESIALSKASLPPSSRSRLPSRL